MNFGYFWVFWRIFFRYTGIPLSPLADPDETTFSHKIVSVSLYSDKTCVCCIFSASLLNTDIWIIWTLLYVQCMSPSTGFHCTLKVSWERVRSQRVLTGLFFSYQYQWTLLFLKLLLGYLPSQRDLWPETLKRQRSDQLAFL